MRRLSELENMPVLTLDGGEQIGTVEAVLVSLDAALLWRLIVRSPVWFSDKRQIPFAEIHRIGADAVVLRGEAAAPFCAEDVGHAQVYDLRYLAEKSIFSEAGAYLGTLADLFFDPATGELKSFEVSDGVIGDLLYGRARLPLPPSQIVCEDRLILPEAMAKLLHF